MSRAANDVQSSIEAINRRRIANTTGVVLPITMKPQEHTDLAIFRHVMEDMAGWIPGDHGLQVEAEAEHLAQLGHWSLQKKLEYSYEKLKLLMRMYQIDEGTLRKHMHTAAAFEADHRMQTNLIGYKHHELLRSQPAAEAKRLMDLAYLNSWTPAELAANMRSQGPSLSLSLVESFKAAGIEVREAINSISFTLPSGIVEIEAPDGFTWKVAT